MVYWYATISYKGYDAEKDAQIRKAARTAGIRNTTGSGYNLIDGERDIGFKIREDQKKILKDAMKGIECKVDFYN